MISAREIRLESEVVALKRQLVAIDAALSGEGLALARRYEVALTEIMRTDSHMTGSARWMARIAQMALQAEKSVRPAKRCQSPACMLSRGHKGYHNDGLREWGKRPHQKPKPMAIPTAPLEQL